MDSKLSNKISNFIKKQLIMNNEIFEIVPFPNVQELMELEGFEENSSLINDEPLLSEYGSSAYFVRKNWLNNNHEKNLF